MDEKEIRLDERRKLQDYIDNNNIYQVEFGHYEAIVWIPLKTKRVNILEVMK